jgi:hypothetical protein
MQITIISLEPVSKSSKKFETMKKMAPAEKEGE